MKKLIFTNKNEYINYIFSNVKLSKKYLYGNKNYSFHDIIANKYDKIIQLYKSNKNFKDIILYNLLKKNNSTTKKKKKLPIIKIHSISKLRDFNKETNLENNDNDSLFLNKKISSSSSTNNFNLITLQKSKLILNRPLIKNNNLKLNKNYSTNDINNNSFNQNSINNNNNSNNNFDHIKDNSNTYETSNIQDSNLKFHSNEASIDLEKKNKNVLFSNIYKNSINKLIYKSYEKEPKKSYSDIFRIIKLQKRNNCLKNNNENSLDSLKDDVKNDNISNWVKNPYYRIGKFNSLLNKCNFEVNRGQNLDKFLDKNIHSDDNIFKRIKNKKLSQNENKDRMIIEEKKLYKNKYDILEKEIYEKIKKRINIKISNEFAYVNRKQFNEMIKNEINIDSYNLFLSELNKIKVIQDKKLEIENQEIRKIENILDNTYKQKEYLKKKIDIKNEYYNKIDKQEKNVDNFPLINNIFELEKSNSMFNLDIKDLNFNKEETEQK